MLALGLGEREKGHRGLRGHAPRVADDRDGVEVAAPRLGVVVEDGEGRVADAALLVELPHDPRAHRTRPVDDHADAPRVQPDQRGLGLGPRERDEHDGEDGGQPEREPARDGAPVGVGVRQPHPDRGEREHAGQGEHDPAQLLDRPEAPAGQQPDYAGHAEVQRDDRPGRPERHRGLAGEGLPNRPGEQHRRRQRGDLGERERGRVARPPARVARRLAAHGDAACERLIQGDEDSFHVGARRSRSTGVAHAADHLSL